MNNQIKNQVQSIFVLVLFFILAFVQGMDVAPLELTGTENAPQSRTSQSSSDKFVLRSRVLANTTSSMSTQSNTAPTQKVIEVVAENEVLVTYFNDAVYSIILDSEISGYAGNRVYSGKIKGEPFLSLVAVLNEKGDIYLTMDNVSTGKSYTLSSEVAGNIVIQEIAHSSKKSHMYTETLPLTIDTAKLSTPRNSALPSGVEFSPESCPEILFSNRMPCDGSTIDVMVLYDTTSKAKKGTQMNSFAESCVQKMNLALKNSQITEFTMRLVHVEAVNITHNSTYEGMLEILKSFSNADLTTGVYGDIKNLRNTCGADLVTCFVDHQANDGLGGVGWSLRETYKAWFADYGYNVVDVDAATSGHTYTHELGHNMGAGHSRTQASQRGPQYYVNGAAPASETDYPNDYSAGYQNIEKSAYTIMAYNFDGTGTGNPGNIYDLELPVFSAPRNYTYNGVSYTIGAANANNTQIIKEQWAYVSNFRTSTSPINPTEETNLCAGMSMPSLSVTVTSNGVESAYSFLKKPSLRFEYMDPYTLKTKKISLKIYNFQKGITSISSWVNSSPQLFDKRLYNRSKRDSYTSSFISSSDAFFQTYPASLSARFNDKTLPNGRVYQITGLSYPFVNPVISALTETPDPYVYTLTGMNFGRTTPKVWIEYKQKGKIKRQSLRVSGAYSKDSVTKSKIMSSKTGVSEVLIKFPKKWMYNLKRPVSEDGYYELVLSNGKGMVAISITFQ